MRDAGPRASSLDVDGDLGDGTGEALVGRHQERVERPCYDDVQRIAGGDVVPERQADAAISWVIGRRVTASAESRLNSSPDGVGGEQAGTMVPGEPGEHLRIEVRDGEVLGGRTLREGVVQPLSPVAVQEQVDHRRRVEHQAHGRSSRAARRRSAPTAPG